jgi:hypothetical protein
MKKALSCSETSVLTRATRRNFPEDGVLHSHRNENLKSYSVVPRSDFSTLMMEAIRSSEASAPTRTTQRDRRGGNFRPVSSELPRFIRQIEWRWSRPMALLFPAEVGTCFSADRPHA